MSVVGKDFLARVRAIPFENSGTLRRPVAAKAGLPPAPSRPPPFRGEERNREDARSPPTPDREADRRRLFSSPLTLLSSPLSGGRSGGGSPARSKRSCCSSTGGARCMSVLWAAGLSPPAPLPGGRREAGRRGRPFGRWRGRWPAGQPPSRPPPFQGGGAQPGGRAFAPTPDREADRRRPRSSPLLFSPPPFQGGGDGTDRPSPARRTAGPFERLPGLHSSPSKGRRLERGPGRDARRSGFSTRCGPPSRTLPWQGEGVGPARECRRRRRPRRRTRGERPPRAGLRGRRIRAIERLSRIGRPPCTASGRAVRVPCRGPPAA